MPISKLLSLFQTGFWLLTGLKHPRGSRNHPTRSLGCSGYRSWWCVVFQLSHSSNIDMLLPSYLFCDLAPWSNPKAWYTSYECEVDSMINWNLLKNVHKQALSVFKIIILLFIVITGWVVLSGKTSVKNPHQNFYNAFAGSSHSGNDVGFYFSIFRLPELSPRSVCNCHLQSLERLCWVVQCKLRDERGQKPSSDAQNRWTTGFRTLCHIIPTCQHRVFRVSIC